MSDQVLRDHLVKLLRGGSAHLGLDEAIQGLPADLRGARVQELPHTAWQLVEHLRIAQWDILEFSRNPGYVTPKWPDDYWPETAAPPDDSAWDRSVEQLRQDLQAMQDLVADSKTDLYAKIPWGDGQTILREALLVADHNAYHVGQIVTLRQALGAWQPPALP
ncbi:MAG TPA: DinB family protein [Thermoanaerobaculia bacterium]|nr:DinB family protein [Thermoanaerobaculia bacterium]